MCNFSLSSAAYSFCLMAAINSAFLYWEYNFLISVDSLLPVVTTALHCTSTVLTCLIGYYISFTQYRKILLAMGLIDLINKKLSCSSSVSVYKIIQGHGCVEFFTMAFSVLACYVTTWYFIRLFMSSHLWFLTFFIIELCIISTSFQFQTFVNFLKQYFIQLNDQLDSFCNRCIMEPLHISRQEFAGPKPPRMTEVTVNSFKPHTPTTVSSVSRILTEIHANLCDLAEIVNGIYGPFLLSSVATDFLFLSFVLHLVLNKIICSSSVMNNFYVTAYPWSIFYTVKLVYFIYSCSCAETEVSYWPQHVVR